MRNKKIVLIGILTLTPLITLTVAFGQPGRGGFPGMPPGGAPGGGFSGFKMSRGSMDPNMIFGMISGGKDYLDQNDLNRMIERASYRDPEAKDRLDRFMQQNNITNGQLTREQYSAYYTQSKAERDGTATPSGTTPSSPGATGGTPPAVDEARIKEEFKRRDRNGDGVLQIDECSSTLRSEIDKWDKNKNGVIEFDEYREYYISRNASRGFPGGMDPRANQGGYGTEVVPPGEEKLVVYRRLSDLPKELPSWYLQVRHQNPGQIALYEWRAANRSLDEFRKYDRNSDGFITVEEVLTMEQKNKSSDPRARRGSKEPAQTTGEEQMFVIAGPNVREIDYLAEGLVPGTDGGMPSPGGMDPRSFGRGGFNPGGGFDRAGKSDKGSYDRGSRGSKGSKGSKGGR